MSDENSGGGLISGMIAGIGLAGFILLPFYIGYRYGIHVLAGLVACLATLYALFSPTLVAIANEMGDCGTCLGAPAAHIILQFDKFGWWWMAGSMWLLFIMMLVAPLFSAEQQDNN
ncbi:hypothetical protein [Methylophilus sp. QUAN]|uniref:hypothetical protein n=1 Tax=Methylophilus sp. QUAN TaxID=2781020 RepID=UPI001890339E|nr:hypothetical protein [Methylophilus sp. QUAN]MBF4991115.1 hypothetical protein [Methylophilus sp. QUAN]